MNGFIDELGVLATGTRLKRLSDHLYKLADTHYAQANAPFQSRWFVPYRYLGQHGEATIGDIAAATGFSHVAIKKLVDEMEESLLVISRKDKDDKRKRLVRLTDKGRDIMVRLEKAWASLSEAFAPQEQTVLQAVRALESGLLQQPDTAAPAITIVDYLPRYKRDFYDLNKDWLDKYFRFEREDDLSLNNPEEYFLAKGGFIFFALDGGEAVGTVALKATGQGYEMCKMAVREDKRGLGIGRMLIRRCMARVKENGGKRLFLQSNDILKPAMRLYEGSGFKYIPLPQQGGDYERANVMMEMDIA